VPARVKHPVQDVVARVRNLQGLGEQIAVVVNDDTARAQDIRERVVLGLRPAHPEHVVEEQVGGVIGGQALEFQVGAVQYHLPQAADFGIHVQHGIPVLGGPRPQKPQITQITRITGPDAASRGKGAKAGYAGAMVVTVPELPRNFRAPSAESTYRTPPAAGTAGSA